MKDLKDVFKERFFELGGEVVEVKENLKDTLRDFLKENGIKKVASWHTPLLREIFENFEDVDVLYPTQRIENYREEIKKVQAGITESIFAVAYSGTIALPVEREKPSLVSLIPEIHIALVYDDRILKDFDDLFKRLWDTGPIEYILASGPSRTADIEQTLTVGVHGPKRVVAFLIPSLIVSYEEK